MWVTRGGEAMLGTQKIVLLFIFYFCSIQHSMFAMEKTDLVQDLTESFVGLALDEDKSHDQEEIKAPSRQKILLFKALRFFIENEQDNKERLRFFRLTKLAPREAIKKYKDCLRQKRNQRIEIRYTSDIKFLKDLIKNYGELKQRDCAKSRYVINLLALEALHFFVSTIKNPEVLYKILHSVRLFPDRAIKLYFFCLEYHCMNRLDEELIAYIERFIRSYFLCRPHYDLQFLTFKRNAEGLPILAMRDNAEWHSDMYDVVPKKQPWCLLM